MSFSWQWGWPFHIWGVPDSYGALPQWPNNREREIEPLVRLNVVLQGALGILVHDAKPRLGLS